MANQRAWWTLVISQEPHGPHDSTIELSDADKEHIGSCIEDDFTEGEVVHDEHELTWESAGTDEPGDQYADSVHRVETGATDAYYALGPALAAPSEDGERWDLTLIQTKHGTEIGNASLGRYPDEPTAKAAAQQYENDATTASPPDPAHRKPPSLPHWLTPGQKRTIEHFQAYNVPAEWFVNPPDEQGTVSVVALGHNTDAGSDAEGFIWSLTIQADGEYGASETTVGPWENGIST